MVKTNKIPKPLIIGLTLLLFLIYILINLSHILIYVVLVVASAYLHYRHYKGFPIINLGHIFFIAFIIDWHDGIAGEILFIVLAGLLPELIAGYIELKTFIGYPLMILIISLPIYFINSNFITVGIITSLVYYGLMFVASSLTGESWHERILEVVVPAILNIIYFMYLAYPLYSLLDFAI